MGKLASALYSDIMTPAQGAVIIAGRFECDGSNAPVVTGKRIGWSVARTGAGTYKVTLERAYVGYLFGIAKITGATASNDDAVILDATFEPGDIRTFASFDIETQSVAGTAADLDGPEVGFLVVLTAKQQAGEI